ncbi:ADP-ribosylation factor-like protein 5A [Serendipita sp. 401]|nr:ADP-ribosylation factor-like protein 5A [Serendipita sp. 397]KAG8826198.1 ADP-ribosylation factor-like protein 5A [Serendipita sp. 401]
MDAVILVVDSADGQQFKSVRWLMDWCLAREHLKGRPLLVLANKQDLLTAVDVSVLAKELGMTSRRDIDWFVCPCSAITGEGLYNGLDWLNNTFQRHRQLKSFEKAEKVTTLS